jgi:hypothetical protein
LDLPARRIPISTMFIADSQLQVRA